MRNFLHQRLIHIVTFIWIGCAIAGMLALAHHTSAPGTAAAPPRTTPAIPALSRRSHRPSLFMFLHPRCPCSSASLNELSRLFAKTHEKMDFTILFVIPPGSPPDWHKSSLWANANSIQGLRVLLDQDGKFATQLGITTSGHCLVYDADDHLVFSGGITSGRGHEGESPGQSMVEGIASQPPADELRECFTFGCQLLTDHGQ
jgi:hypothetical protein